MSVVVSWPVLGGCEKNSLCTAPEERDRKAEKKNERISEELFLVSYPLQQQHIRFSIFSTPKHHPCCVSPVSPRQEDYLYRGQESCFH